MSMITLSGPLEKTDRPHQSGGGAGPGVSLKPGDHLAAKVLRIGTDQRVLMDFGRFRALTYTDQTVKPGQTLMLKVMDSGSPIHMQILSDGKVTHQPPMPQINVAQALTINQQRDLGPLLNRMLESKALVSAFDDHQGLRQALVDLRDLNAPLSLELPPKEIAAHLQLAIEERSLFFEKNLAQWLIAASKDSSAALSRESPPAAADEAGDQAGHGRSLAPIPDLPGLGEALLATRDLKAQLLLIKSFLNQINPADARTYASKPKEVKFLQEVVDHLLGHLQEQQEHLIQRSTQSHLFQVMAHWLPVKDQNQPLKLKLYYPKKERPQDLDRPQYVCLLLDMDRLGPVRADLRLAGRELQVTFSVMTRDIRQAFESALRGIVPALEDLFDEVQALVQVSAEKIARFDEEQMVTSEPGRIDLKA